MNTPEDKTRVVQPSYMLPSLLLTGLGYYIAFHIAEQPGTPNVLLLKLLGIITMGVFGATFIMGLRKLLPTRNATSLKTNLYKEQPLKSFTKH